MHTERNILMQLCWRCERMCVLSAGSCCHAGGVTASCRERTQTAHIGEDGSCSRRNSPAECRRSSISWILRAGVRAQTRTCAETGAASSSRCPIHVIKPQQRSDFIFRFFHDVENLRLILDLFSSHTSWNNLELCSWALTGSCL